MAAARVSHIALTGYHAIRRLMTHPAVLLILRLYIGGVFIYASMYKINYPAEFADTIASYQLAPAWSINLLAVLMPWMELVAGVLLVLGWRTQAAAAIIAALLVLFCVVILVTLVRDVPIGCGCFTSVEEPMGWHTLGRDLVWLAMALLVFAKPSAWQLESRLMAALREMLA
jgi:putative oxidoreductase